MPRPEILCAQCERSFSPAHSGIQHCSQLCRNTTMRQVVYLPLTAERLRSLINYEPTSGVFTWLVNRGGQKIGSIAGVVSNHRRFIKVDKKMYGANRLAWIYMTGSWPSHEVDHIDNDSLNDSWVNLRDVSRQVNQQNLRRPMRRNQSGFLGVTSSGNGYLARLYVNGVQKCLGTYPTPIEAHEAYMSAKRQQHEGCTA